MPLFNEHWCAHIHSILIGSWYGRINRNKCQKAAQPFRISEHCLDYFYAKINFPEVLNYVFSLKVQKLNMQTLPDTIMIISLVPSMKKITQDLQVIGQKCHRETSTSSMCILLIKLGCYIKHCFKSSL